MRTLGERLAEAAKQQLNMAIPQEVAKVLTDADALADLNGEPRPSEQVSGYAFSRALALESLPDDIRAQVFKDGDGFAYQQVSLESLVKFATTVAYKVFHGVKGGHKMDPTMDPIMVGETPAAEYWPEHYKD